MGKRLKIFLEEEEACLPGHVDNMEAKALCASLKRVRLPEDREEQWNKMLEAEEKGHWSHETGSLS